MSADSTTPSPTPETPQRTTGGNFRWEPPSPAELQEQMPGYTIEKLLGRGGMGAVYKGVQSNLDRPVAIKILPPGVDQEDPSFAERFKNEARLMARLNNPAVVSVHDFGLTTGGLLYFAMEYVDGTDVSQMIRSQGKLPPEHALAITAHVCDALSAAHELGIVHRDIKPANVLINMKGQVKVADFGLAKIEEPGTHGLTKTGYAMGTPDFVAPEVLMLGSNIDGRADLYAVGVMLYQMLTGEVPRGAFKPATARLPGLDPRFDPIILKAMQSDREERYQSSTELRRDLDVILTVPLVRQDEPPTSAIPAAQVAQTPAQRSAAQKPPARSAGAPTRQPPAHAGEGTRAPVPPKKSSAPLLLGLGAVAAVGIGAFVMFSGGEKAKQSGPLSPLSGTSGAGLPETSKPNPPKTLATGQTIASKNAPSQGDPAATAKPSNPPPATNTSPTTSSPIAASNWQRVERTEARWKELGFEAKDGWVPFLTSPGESQKAWVISNDIKGKRPRDVAVRIRFRHEKSGHVSLNCRYDTATPVPHAILWDDGRFELGISKRPPGTTPGLQEVKRVRKPAVGEEGILELAVIGQKVIARLNSSTVLEREVPGMSPGGPFEVRSIGHWIRDAEYLSLDGVPDPLKELGWNVPAASAAAPAASGTGTSAASQIPTAKSPQPARLPAPAKWVKAFETPKSLESFKGQAEWTQSGIHLTGTIAPTSSELQDAAVRLKVKKGANIGLMLRAKKDNKWSANINTSQGTANFQVTQDGAKLALEQFDVPPSLAALEEIEIEFVGVGNILSLSMNGVQVGSMAAPAKTSTGMLHIFSADGYVRDIAWQSLDGPASAAEKTATATAAPPPVSPSPSLPVSSSPPPATTMAAAPVSELDQRLAAIDASFQAAVERDANTAFKASMAALDKLYLGALDRALATASKDGKLEEALALREEKQRIEKGEGVPSEVDESTQAPGKVPDTLKTLRKTYRSTTAQHEATKAKAMQPLYDKYDLALAAVQTELTQAQKLDDAMRVKTVREQFAATRGGATAPAAAANGPVAAGTPSAALAGASAPPSGSTLLATKDKPFTNSLGMKFIPLKDTDVLFCIHETRRQDYEVFAKEMPGVDALWKKPAQFGSASVEGDDHPVVNVNWDDAQAFSLWLSKKEGRTYRLPADREWSLAIGIERDEKRTKDDTPKTLSGRAGPLGWVWGTQWPPPKDSGNFFDLTQMRTVPNFEIPADKDILHEKYNDGYVTTAPVMSFRANRQGLHDLGGNVWEWCLDWYDAEQTMRYGRGGAWTNHQTAHLHAGRRLPQPQNARVGDFGFRVVLETRAPAATSATTKPATPAPTPPTAPTPAPATAAKSDFTNSLGMKFVKVTGTKVLFCIHETRYKDYAAYATAVPTVNPRWKNQSLKNVAPKGPTDDHPVVIVSWEDAQAFCAWLSQKEGKRYRLPTDEEWSYAVGIGRDEKRKKDDTPATVSRVNEYPWGTKWPPSKGCENYGDESYKAAIGEQRYLKGYDDGYPTTAPVMSFKPNRSGLYDMGGNVSEYCEDWLNNTQTSRVLRGSSWKGGGNDFELLSSARGQAGTTTREDNFGFRIVLETTD